jgi:amino acid transporter
MSSDHQSSTLAEGVVGFPTALATSIGLIIAASVVLTATQGFGVAGGTFAIAVVIAYVVMMAQSSSFGEAAGLLPTAGSVYDYVAAGMGRFFAITGTLAAYLIVHLFAGTAETASAGLFAAASFEPLEGLADGGSWIIGVALLLIFAIVNYLGIELYGRAEVGLTAFMWLTLFLFGLIGTLKAKTAPIDGFFGDGLIGPAPDFETVLSMVGLAMFLFVGVEYVTPLASELKDPFRNVPKAMYVGVTMVAIAMFLYGAGVTRQVENVLLDEEAEVFLFDTPFAIPEFANSVMGQFGIWWLGLAVLIASAATINTLMAGIPRILYGMAKDGTLPEIFGRVHPRYKSPYVGVVVAFLIPAIYAIVIDGDIDSIFVLILAAVCAWLFSYILVNISVISLRVRKPELDRPFKSPLYPVSQIVAIAALLVTMWYIAPPFLTRGEIYVRFFLMLGLSAAYALVWLLLVKKKEAWRPVEPSILIAEERL